jgi:hypothetical protein
MKPGGSTIIIHLARMAIIILLIVLCIIYPFLPGEYDSLAIPLSTMAQGFGVLGLLLVPVGGLWLAYELRSRARRKQNLPVKARSYYFALVSGITSLVVAAAVSLIALTTTGLAFALLTLALWLYIAAKLVPRLRVLKNAERESFNPTPFYLIVIPLAVFLSQLTLATPATAFSRNYAITMSAEFINDIEEYRAVHGYYPSSLLAVNEDYYPSVVGIENFHYAPDGDAFNLFFEQPRFLLDNIGTREFVVYNMLDEHLMISHTAWILTWTPEELAVSQGWYAVYDTSSPHWKYFWFD